MCALSSFCNSSGVTGVRAGGREINRNPTRPCVQNFFANSIIALTTMGSRTSTGAMENKK